MALGTKHNDYFCVQLVKSYLENQGHYETRRLLEEETRNWPKVELGGVSLESISSHSMQDICKCFSKANFGANYTHLGHAESLEGLRSKLESTFQVGPNELRIEEVRHCSKKGRSIHGCPTTRQTLQRLNEKYLVLAKERQGHECSKRWMVVAIVAWSDISIQKADEAFHATKNVLVPYGIPDKRKCEFNAQKSCSCQGTDLKRKGVSFTLGCVWASFTNACKFAKSHKKGFDKFNLRTGTPYKSKEQLENVYKDLARDVSKLCSKLIPEAFTNMVAKDSKCRLSNNGAFAGMSIVADFCAHIHKDLSNMNGGVTAVLSLVNPNSTQEQVHILSQYVTKYLSNDVGGLGIYLTHGSVLFEYAKEEWHSTSSLQSPDRHNPSRIGLVFYQHRRLHHPEHGRGITVHNTI